MATYDIIPGPGSRVVVKSTEDTIASGFAGNTGTVLFWDGDRIFVHLDNIIDAEGVIVQEDDFETFFAGELEHDWT